jgi:O-antigen/teichoic acid export membrane protein
VAPILGVSVAVWLIAAVPIALVFGQGDSEVEALVTAQLALVPVFAVTQSALGVAMGEERWKTIALMRLTAAVVPVIGLLSLHSLGRLTLLTASGSYFTATLLASTPAFLIWWRARPLQRDAKTTREGWEFGRAAMMTTLLTLGSVRADALVVAQLLSFSDAGNYVVAATLASPPLTLAGAAMASLARRISLVGLGPVTATYTRMVLAVAFVAACGIGVVAPFLIPFLFGEEFRGSVQIAQILLIGTVCGAAGNFLSLAVSFAGHPGVASWGQFVGLAGMMATMVPLGLAFGVSGCAAGSVFGYAATFVFLMAWASRQSGLPCRSYGVVRLADLRQLKAVFRSG